jgi:M6 family metalloprotease-like protein
MKNVTLALLLFLCILSAYAQNKRQLPPSVINCTIHNSASMPNMKGLLSTQNGKNGLSFTMKGNLRILIIYAGFGEDCNTSLSNYNDWNWPNDDIHGQGLTACKTFPVWHSGLFYNNYTQFSQSNNDQSISNYYYKMSLGQFKVIAEAFPERVNIPLSQFNDIYDWNVLANHIKNNWTYYTTTYPGFDWSHFDSRTNYPNFLADNSNTSPDNHIDFVLVMWRIDGSSGGYNHLSPSTVTVTPEGVSPAYSLSYKDGLSMNIWTSEYWAKNLLLHEISHAAFSCPHFGEAEPNISGVVGNHFYTSGMWGAMQYGIFSRSASGFERWYNGWITPVMINNASQNGVYTLRDFVTQGDAIRIEIPNTNPKQHIWLENHQNITALDGIPGAEGYPVGANVPDVPKGVFAYAEDMAPTHSTILGFSTPFANGYKAMHASGNHDYVFQSGNPEYNYWGNMVFNFSVVAPNPFSPHNELSAIRANFPTPSFYPLHPNTIHYNNFTNGSYNPNSNNYNECATPLKINGNWR